MIRAFYSGTAGMRAQQSGVDVVANNIANVNTSGYREQVEQFSDLLYSSMEQPQTANAARLLAGAGQKPSNIKTDLQPGTTVQTGNALDFAVDGDGFFCLEDAAGNRFYTRDGSFQASNQGGGYELVNARGLRVLDAGGNPIAVDNGGNPSAMPGVYDVNNEQGLTRAGDNLYAVSADSGAAFATNTPIKQRSLEGSNVDLAGQMTRLIVSQRGYQLSSSMVQTANQVETMVDELGQ